MRELQESGDGVLGVCEELVLCPPREVWICDDSSVLVCEGGELCEVEEAAAVAGQQGGREQVAAGAETLLLVAKEGVCEVAQQEKTGVGVAGLAEGSDGRGKGGQEGGQLGGELLFLGKRGGKRTLRCGGGRGRARSERALRRAIVRAAATG